MTKIDYSVIIRTTGKAHEKYQSLLDSIAKLDPAPKEVIVVLPEGYCEPDEKLGWETFYYSLKGMVIQRLYGISQCKTRYALVCDDDVCFDFDFVQKLYEPVSQGLCGISAGPLYSFLPQKGLKAFFSAISGAALPTVFHRDRYVSVLTTTGYSYNRHLNPRKKRYYEAQSLAWTCFFADIQSLRDIALEDEVWLDAHGYSAYDDQTMFYKAWLRGIKTIVVANAYYEHKDAKTSTRNNQSNVLYSLAFNRIVFWRRFVYDTKTSILAKIWSKIAFEYRLAWIKVWAYIDLLRKRCGKADFDVIKKALREGKKYVSSDEFKNLPPVRKEKS